MAVDLPVNAGHTIAAAVRLAGPAATERAIVDQVTEYFGVAPIGTMGLSAKPSLRRLAVEARWVAAYLLWYQLAYSMAEVARVLRCDRTTVRHALCAVERDDRLMQVVSVVERRVAEALRGRNGCSQP